MSFTKIAPKKNGFMLDGKFARQGYDWWWHSFTGKNAKTGQEKSFFIEFFTCNPALCPEKVILGQESENKKNGVKPSYLMIKCGAWGDDACQLHRFFAWKDVQINSLPLKVQAGDCLLTNESLDGKVCVSKEEVKAHPETMSDSGQMEFHLKIQKIIPFNVGYGTSALFRKLKAFQMYWHASGIKSKFEGTVILNGEEYDIAPETSNGYSDKNWGSDFTSPWVWLSSNRLISKTTGKVLENSVFDIGGGCPCVFGIHLKRKLLSVFYYEGQEFEFNFSKFWTFTKTKFDCKETDDKIIWHVYQESIKGAMETQMECDKSQMLLVNYEAPDGSKKHNRLWNGGTGCGTIKLWKKKMGKKILLDQIQVQEAGCEWGEFC